MASAQNVLAKTLRSLHVPGDPLILTNVWDAISAKAIAQLPQTKALATASFAVATAAGLEDSKLDLDTNLRGIKAIATIAKQFNKPLTADFQDGYGTRLEEGVRAAVKLGVVGINLEDFGRELGDKGEFYPISTAQDRIRKVVNVANEEGVTDFVVNARVDALLHGKPLDEAIKRGKAYLEAGAANIFVLGSHTPGGTTKAELEELVKAFDGKLNVGMNITKPNMLTVSDLKAIGVARISVGPQLSFMSAEWIGKEVEKILAKAE